MKAALNLVTRPLERLNYVWELVRSGLWFVPTVMVCVAVVTAFGLMRVDTWLGPDLLDRWPLVFGAGAAGARSLLVAVASSMITVAGVAFSITIVALSLAASQYSSRVLRNFMSDRMNQVVLGVFISTFAYCILLLRTIRGGDEDAFVAPVSVTFAVVLAFVGIGFFVYFLHHIALSIQASYILASIETETAKAIERRWPDRGADDQDLIVEDVVAEDEPTEKRPGHGAEPVDYEHCLMAERSGYLAHVDTQAMVDWARNEGRRLRLESSIGSFCILDQPLLSISGPAPSDEERKLLLGSIELSRQRTSAQDPSYGIRQMVDIALKALSPGINDTTNAVMALNYLASILVRLAGRRFDSDYRDTNGEVRLSLPATTFADHLDQGIDQIRHHAAGNVAVLRKLIEVLSIVAQEIDTAPRRQAVEDHYRKLAEAIERTVESPIERADLERQLAEVRG